MSGNVQELNYAKVQDLDTLNVGPHTVLLGYDTVGNKFGRIAVSSLKDKIPWFGRRWPKGNSSPVGVPIGDIDLGQVFAQTIGLGGYLVQNNHTREKLSAVTHLLKANGAAADLSGAAGHYNWGWNVPMYYQEYETATDFCETFSLGGPRPGFWNYYIPVGSRSCAGYAAMDRTNSVLKNSVNSTAQYRGGDNDSSLDETYKSQLCKPVTKMNITALRTAARQNGTLWYANDRVMQYVTAALKRVIFGNRNIQAAYNANLDSNGLLQGGTGQGIDQPTDWSGNFGNFPYIRLDVGVSNGDFTGLLSTTIDENGTQKTIGNIPCFYGLKNDYKYLVCMSENMLLQANADKSQSLFIDNHMDGRQMDLTTVAGLTKIATGPVAETKGWQYPKEWQLKNLSFFPGTELGGSSSTYYCDGYYNPADTSGLRGAFLLGNADNGDNAGSLYLRGYDGVGAAYAGWGAFLCEWAEEFSTEPFFCTAA